MDSYIIEEIILGLTIFIILFAFAFDMYLQNGDKFCWNSECLASPIYSAYLAPVEGAVAPEVQKCKKKSDDTTTATTSTTASTTTTAASNKTAATVYANGVSVNSSASEADKADTEADKAAVNSSESKPIDGDKKPVALVANGTASGHTDDASVRDMIAIYVYTICMHFCLCYA
jgi:hypothetical protein